MKIITVLVVVGVLAVFAMGCGSDTVEIEIEDRSDELTPEQEMQRQQMQQELEMMMQHEEQMMEQMRQQQQQQ